MDKNDIIFTTIKILTSDGVGTGFLIDFDTSGKKEAVFLVTNKHVVEGQTNLDTFLTVQGKDGLPFKKPHTIYNFRSRCFFHEKYDLCAISFQIDIDSLKKAGFKVFGERLTMGDICSDDEVLECGSISNLYVVGYPADYSDVANNLPIVRSGVTSTPLYINFEGVDEFAIDAGILKGNSGSPVFVDFSGNCKLIGIVYFTKIKIDSVDIKNCKCVEGFVDIPTGLGRAVKAQELFFLWKKAGAI